MTTFSMMSDPDILLTIQAYTFTKQELILNNVDGKNDIKIERLETLSNSLISEWEKRGNL